MNRIERKFRELKGKKKKAFIAFITAGYPDLKSTEKVLAGLSGIADIVELGVPFSDPLADGPIIQEASQAALKRGCNLHDILRLVKRARRKVDTPICLMTYYNPVFCFGEEKFCRAASLSGVDGLIVPDLPPEEAVTLRRWAARRGIDIINFISPTTSRERIRYISSCAKGFIYYVSLTGVTGPRQKLPAGLIKKLKIVKRLTRKPVCVGFGVSSAGQVKEINKVADGVIVGSAIVNKIRENMKRPDLSARVSSFVRRLKG